MSKTALITLMNQYHVRLASEGFKILGVDSGLVVLNLLDRSRGRGLG